MYLWGSNHGLHYLISLSSHVLKLNKGPPPHTHTHTHTHIYIYMFTFLMQPLRRSNVHMLVFWVLELWDDNHGPLVAFMNSYCMFKITFKLWQLLLLFKFSYFWFGVFYLVLLIVLYFNMLVTIDEMSVLFGFTFWLI